MGYSILPIEHPENHPSPVAKKLPISKKTIAIYVISFLIFLELFMYFLVPNAQKLLSIQPPVLQHRLKQIWPDFPLPLQTGRKKNVTIFVQTPWYGADVTKMGVIPQCPNNMKDWCLLTSEPEHFATADAILFHNRDFKQSLYPKERNLDQIYVMATVESPVHESVAFLPDQINWTMNYRLDSDMPYPYFVMETFAQPRPVDFENIWNTKNHSVSTSWLVTNCNTPNKRMEIVEKARKEGLNADVFGSCGQELPNCGRDAADRNGCAAKVIKKYKFYIAMENSNCPGYATEKFFNTVKNFFAVPVVLNRLTYEELGVPSSAFIALDDFKSIKEMVNFINRVQSDKQRYLEFHKWRETHEPVNVNGNIGFCGLCEKLRIGGHPRQSYLNLQEWYSAKTCDNTAFYKYLD